MIAYMLLTGNPPFPGKQTYAIHALILSKDAFSRFESPNCGVLQSMSSFVSSDMSHKFTSTLMLLAVPPAEIRRLGVEFDCLDEDR